MPDLFGNTPSGAIFSEDRSYRYMLWRIWDETKPLVMFIGLNPSRASEYADDPTIKRVKAISSALGYGGCYMLNLFAYITPYPDKLIMDEGWDKENADWMEEVAGHCKNVVFAWGNFKINDGRDVSVKELFPQALALQVNKNLSPKHPLYVRKDVQPVHYVQYCENYHPGE